MRERENERDLDKEREEEYLNTNCGRRREYVLTNILVIYYNIGRFLAPQLLPIHLQ